MGILVNKDLKDDSKLQQQITADLREKAARQSRDEGVDGVSDSEYIKNLGKTNRFSWIWFVLILLAVISIIVILVL